MAATQIQLRRGTSAQCAAMTPVAGEPTWDTTNERLRMGNGSTAGGVIIPNYKDLLTRPFTYVNAGGTANALTITLPITFSYAAGVGFSFKATATNSSASPTINVNSLGALTLKKSNGTSLVDLAAGDLINGVIYEIGLDGTYAQVLNIAATPVSPVQTNTPTTFTSQSDIIITCDFTTYTSYRLELHSRTSSVKPIDLLFSSNGGSSYASTFTSFMYDTGSGVAITTNWNTAFAAVGTQPQSHFIDLSQTLVTARIAHRLDCFASDFGGPVRGTGGGGLTAACNKIKMTFASNVSGEYVLIPLNKR